RDGVQSERFADGSVYAFARTDARSRTEYLVAANNAAEARTVELDAPAGARYRTLYGGSALLRASAAGKLTVTVPALGSVVLQGAAPLAAPATKPALTLKAPAPGATGTVELSADVTGGGLNRVVFAAQTGTGHWQVLGSADHAPYKVTQHVSAPAGTALRYKAVVV
ncbi:alpha amylase C-terminal domain-containing protein, partial [Streptomyces sp. SID13726]|uniref:alpha amylase C-terminal domain-containing protein n=2 Tax=unclassified Streptomyces TaxID=2593676 RepID=UPI0013B714C5